MSSILNISMARMGYYSEMQMKVHFTNDEPDKVVVINYLIFEIRELFVK